MKKTYVQYNDNTYTLDNGDGIERYVLYIGLDNVYGGYILESAGDPTGLNELEDNGCETEIAALDQIINDPTTPWQELTEDDLSYIADTLTAWGIDQ